MVRSVVALVAVAALLLPASALAHSRASSKSVRDHVVAADRALDRVTALSRTDIAGAAAQVLRVRLETAAALKDAGRLLKGSDSPAERRVVAVSYRLIGLRQDEIVHVFAALVDEATGAAQAAIAAELPGAVSGRQITLDMLSTMLKTIPAALQPSIARVVAALSKAIEGDVAVLAETLRAGTLPVPVAGLVSSAIRIATSALDQVVVQLDFLTETLPPVARAPVAAALGFVQGQLTFVTQLIGDVLKPLGVQAGIGVAASSP